MADEHSIFHFYKELLAYRKANKTLVYGQLDILLPESEELFVYRRYDETHDFLIMLNFTNHQIRISDIDLADFQLEMSDGVTAEQGIGPWGARIYKKVIVS